MKTSSNRPEINHQILSHLYWHRGPTLLERLLIIPYLEDISSKAKLSTTSSRAASFRFMNLHFERLSLNTGREDYGYSNIVDEQNLYRLRNSKLFSLVLRRFKTVLDQYQVPKQHPQSELERLKAVVAAYLQSHGRDDSAFPIMEKNREVAEAFYQSDNYARLPTAFMSLLQDLKDKHQAQVSTFDTLIEKTLNNKFPL